jgi:L-amino acid N-acyltransferase YncA
MKTVTTTRGTRNEPPVRVRDATADDFTSVAAIYGHYVSTGTGSFEEIAPTVDEMRRRFDQVQARGLPWRVAEVEGEVVGYCHASPFHARSAYRFSVRDSIYVDPRWLRRGIGRALLQSVIDTCEQRGYWQMVASIGDSANEPTIRLHTLLGFRTIGYALRVGLKFGRWLDVVYMQRTLVELPGPAPQGYPRGFLPATDQTGP